MTGGECKQFSIDNGGSRAKENQCNIEKIKNIESYDLLVSIAMLAGIIAIVIILIIRGKQND